MKVEEIINHINKWIRLTPLDERVCLLSMCKNWIKHQATIIEENDVGLLEAYKVIIKDNLYMEDGGTWCNKCGGVDDKFARGEVLHLSEDCIVHKAEEYIGEHMLKRIIAWYEDKHKNDCSDCKGRGYYYPLSNIGGSCRIDCPTCSGIGIIKGI